MTKLDGDARGGAALSVKEVTGKPIKFLGMGEPLDKLEEFRPEGLASRILGMGDIVGLVKDFEQVVDAEKAEEDALRMLKGKFDMQDFLEQIRLIQKMGSLKDLFEKLPFFPGGLPEGVNLDDRELVKIEAMISSMTVEERTNPQVFVATSWETSPPAAGRMQAPPRPTSTPARQARREGLGPQRERGQGAAAEVRADAPDDGAARRVDGPDGQDPRLQAVLADEEAGGHRPVADHERGGHAADGAEVLGAARQHRQEQREAQAQRGAQAAEEEQEAPEVVAARKQGVDRRPCQTDASDAGCPRSRRSRLTTRPMSD